MLRTCTFIGGLLLTSGSWAMAQTASVAVDNNPDGLGQAATGATAPTVYFTADELPSFPGGDAALLKFLSSRLNYPAAALDRHLSGKVYLTFVVDSEGHLHDPHVVRGLGAGLDEEALRLVRLMPWWNPGKVHGQPVWVSVTMPIVFRAL
ncbi:energy transducer TonB [Hymenobacter negativus]|uniref:Energy transducer TonB n=1 Tax=Hymenobacter negativus TaxID=2795026 RepID=A0ABS3QKE3_9BACT|nr:energy transducer TonB [Hymenobacter negativus]MBO2011726.1 energy transducer TonB [Hymenobacter negativus]